MAQEHIPFDVFESQQPYGHVDGRLTSHIGVLCFVCLCHDHRLHVLYSVAEGVPQDRERAQDSRKSSKYAEIVGKGCARSIQKQLESFIQGNFCRTAPGGFFLGHNRQDVT